MNMEKLKALFLKYYDVMIYLVFGVLTTVVNYMVYLPCYNLWNFTASQSNVIAWVVAVAFAFLTNKPFVFHSHDWSPKVVMSELTAFVGTRVCSGGLETLIIFVAVDLLGLNGNIWKVVTSVIVVILNYIGSKLIVFRKK